MIYLYSKPEIEAAAYRVPNSPAGCEAVKPLSQSIKDQLQKESTQCLKPTFIPTKVRIFFVYLLGLLELFTRFDEIFEHDCV